MGYLFALGFISILGQVVLLRELSVASYGIELVYTISLGIWLLSTACGTLLWSTRRSALSLSRINLFFLLFSVSLPLDVAFIRLVRLLMSDLPGAYLPLHSQIAAICASLLPIGLILGLLFQWSAGVAIDSGRSLAFAYAIESIGGLAGGLCATLLLKFGFQNFLIALVCALVSAGAAFFDLDGHSVGKMRAVALAIVAGLILLVWKAPALDRRMTAWTHPNMVDTEDSPYSRITVTFLDGQVSVFENDALLFDTESTRAEEFVHLAALQQPNPQRVLVLGGGVEGTLQQILMYSPQIVDYVELNPTLLHVVLPNLPLKIQKSFRAKNVRVIEADPRKFLETALTYDLILVGMPEPGSGQANRFYTREFFAQCREKLNANGVLAFRLQSSENLWSPQLTRRMTGIYRAARSAFPEVLFIPGTTNVVVCSTGLLTKDPQILTSRFADRKLETKIVSPNFLRYLFTNDRFPEIARTLEAGTAPVNTDMRPICYQYTAMMWLSKLLPSARYWDFTIPEIRADRRVLWLVGISIPALLLSTARWSIRRVLLMGVVGFAGMTLETVLILYFQTKSGVLYQDIGLLLTGFMAGLALGALGTERLAAIPSRVLGFLLLGSFAFFCGVVGRQISAGTTAALPLCLAFLVLTGILVSGIFAYAGNYSSADQRRAITPLYAADLIGGCLGSLLASLILAPMVGMATASYLMIPLLILSVLLL